MFVRSRFPSLIELDMSRFVFICLRAKNAISRLNVSFSDVSNASKLYRRPFVYCEIRNLSFELNRTRRHDDHRFPSLSEERNEDDTKNEEIQKILKAENFRQLVASLLEYKGRLSYDEIDEVFDRFHALKLNKTAFEGDIENAFILSLIQNLEKAHLQDWIKTLRKMHHSGMMSVNVMESFCDQMLSVLDVRSVPTEDLVDLLETLGDIYEEMGIPVGPIDPIELPDDHPMKRPPSSSAIEKAPSENDDASFDMALVGELEGDVRPDLPQPPLDEDFTYCLFPRKIVMFDLELKRI